MTKWTTNYGKYESGLIQSSLFLRNSTTATSVYSVRMSLKSDLSSVAEVSDLFLL